MNQEEPGSPGSFLFHALLPIWALIILLPTDSEVGPMSGRIRIKDQIRRFLKCVV